MPAYLYLFAKAFIEDAIANGIDFETAKKLAVESIKSSCDMILESKDSIDTLITNVCSKGGTTIAGLNVLKENGFEDTISKCARACANRSKELSK
jgi:pyrroline-5-carboxylate reductase